MAHGGQDGRILLVLLRPDRLHLGRLLVQVNILGVVFLLHLILLRHKTE